MCPFVVCIHLSAWERKSRGEGSVFAGVLHTVIFMHVLVGLCVYSVSATVTTSTGSTIWDRHFHLFPPQS